MSRILRYVSQRLLLTLPMLFILLTVVFLILRVLPGDPVSAMLGGRNVSQEVIESYRVKLGFDEPLLAQYVDYLGGIVRGDFGNSLRTGRPVLYELFIRFPALYARGAPFFMSCSSDSQRRSNWLSGECSSRYSSVSLPGSSLRPV